MKSVVFFYLRRVPQLLVTAKAVPGSPILVTSKIKAICSSETSVPIRATQNNVPEDGILQHFVPVKQWRSTWGTDTPNYYGTLKQLPSS
jgi:hypothetical protein